MFKAASYDVDEAVGVPEVYWFVAIVSSRAEKKVAEKLADAGLEAYVPVQEEVRVWKNGRKANVARVLIPSKVFIRCSETTRRQIIKMPYILRFMTNRAGAATSLGNKPLAHVPDAEIEKLKFILGASNRPVTFAERFVKGQRMQVLRGPFRGLEGEILKDTDGSASRLYINIDFLGSASVEIDVADLEPLKQA